MSLSQRRTEYRAWLASGVRTEPKANLDDLLTWLKGQGQEVVSLERREIVETDWEDVDLPNARSER